MADATSRTMAVVTASKHGHHASGALNAEFADWCEFYEVPADWQKVEDEFVNRFIPAKGAEIGERQANCQ